jgi:cytochrome c2
MFFIIAMLTVGHLFADPPSEEGKRIFTARCAACHHVNKTLTGPALAGVTERRSMEWIINFVHSSQTVVKSGDKDAVALFEKFNKITMPDHKDLSADDIGNIMEYIKASTVATIAGTSPFRKPDMPLKPNYTPFEINNYPLMICYFGAIGLLAGALLALVKVKSLQRQKLEGVQQSDS